MSEERRTFNTPIREPWNPVIHRLLQAVDHHNSAFLRDGNPWHLQKATFIREYLHELKTWMHAEEAKVMEDMVKISRTEGR